jgi:opine dehydrogenase
MKRAIGIVGAGAIGLATAADYFLAGYDVYLSETEQYINRLPQDGKFFLHGLSFKKGARGSDVHAIQVRPVLDYADFNEAQCEGVIVATTAHAHQKLLPILEQKLAPEMPLVVFCGAGSTLAHIPTRTYVGETNTAPYGVRRCEGGICVKILTPQFGVGSQRIEWRDSLLTLLRSVYSEALPLSHIIDANLSNPNPLMHVSIMLANLTRIDHGESFAFYGSGLTKSVRNLILQKDHERCAIANALGYDPILFDNMLGVIEIEGQLVVQEFLECGSYSQLKAPMTVQDRYFTEDVPFGLVVWEALGKQLSVPTPLISAEIDYVSAILKQDMRSETKISTNAICKRV